MPVALETFLSQLSESGILSDQKLRAVERKKKEYQDGESLARDMIKSSHLTKYQAEQILGGKGKNLCMGQYVLLEKLGAGGMGQVYKAYHPGMERVVAVKMILANSRADAEAIKRFQREVKAAAKLAHPNIITVYDAGNANGRHFMVMELVKGQDLSEIINQKGKFSIRDAVDYITQAAKGLKFAHSNGVIHRDIKPGNLILDSEGILKIVDMGLAKINSKENDETVSALTGNAAIMGTVDFMSPEQSLSTRDVDARADIYSLGATLYYLLTGNVMYPSNKAMAKLMAHRKSLIPSLRVSRPDVSENLEAVYVKMVAKQAEDRYQNMSELISKLESIANQPAPIDIPKDLETIDPLRNDFGEFATRKKSNKKTQIKFGFITIFSPGRYLNNKFVAIVGGTLVGMIFVLLPFFWVGKFKIFDQQGFQKKSGAMATVDKNSSGNISEAIKLTKENIIAPPFLESKIKNPLEEMPTKEKVNDHPPPPTMSKEENVKPVLSEILAGLEKEMIFISAGKFSMGAPLTESGRGLAETLHEVNITMPFYLGKYEVSQEQWEAINDNNPSETKGPKLPVTSVSWDDCQTFIKKLNEKTKGGYRLPTEAEWEYACRAGTTTAYSFGSTIKKNDANFSDGTSGAIKPVGSYKANPYGIYDMHGNVYEWCEDWFAPYAEGLVTNPKGPAVGEFRVLRGGSFSSNDENSLRCANRFFNAPVNRFTGVGFRLVRNIVSETVNVPAKIKPDPAPVIRTKEVLLVAPFNESKAKEMQKELAKSLQKEVEEKEDLGKGIKLDLILIPDGKFKMGSPSSEKGRSSIETQHEVIITKPFYIGKYEVTQEQWESVMGSNPSIKTKGTKLPVTDISWEDCQEFIKKLNNNTAGGYRLPTEAEWEFACRAGTTTAYSFGETITQSEANYKDLTTGKPVVVKAVGAYKPNSFGLYDMHGNVWEWCEDWKADYPTGPTIDPKGPETGPGRVLRGGSFYDVGTAVRSSSRDLNTPSLRFDKYGFRLVRTK